MIVNASREQFDEFGAANQLIESVGIPRYRQCRDLLTERITLWRILANGQNFSSKGEPTSNRVRRDPLVEHEYCRDRDA